MSTTHTVRNVCPRNCFSTCSLLTEVKDGRPVRVKGDPRHGFNRGKLCAKGYAYPAYDADENRLLYPLRQYPRHSGRFHRITWEEAFADIAAQLFASFDRWGTNKAAAYHAFSGNLGILQNNALKGLFRGLGAHTAVTGNPCLGTGREALRKQQGGEVTEPPERMAEARAVVIWGANPAVTNIHQMKFIHAARDRGGELAVIDPVFTESAKAADVYVQLAPDGDGWAAAAVIKLLIEQGAVDEAAIEAGIDGGDEFVRDLRALSWQTLMHRSGAEAGAIAHLAKLYHPAEQPVMTWIGYGLQRSRAGAFAVRAIDALAVVTGHRHMPGGTVYYFHPEQLNVPNQPASLHPLADGVREIDFRTFAKEAAALADPPVEMLWLFSRNPLAQDGDRTVWKEWLRSLNLVVTSDLMMTETAACSDIILPATTMFEHHDLHVSYWNHWLSLNETAASPRGEARSELATAASFSRYLNAARPGFSRFRDDLSETDWLELEIDAEMQRCYGIRSWQDLRRGPVQRQEPHAGERLFRRPDFSGKNGSFLAERPSRTTNQDRSRNFRLLSPQSLLRIHSQFAGLKGVSDLAEARAYVYIHPADAADHGVNAGDTVLLYNSSGEIERTAALNAALIRGVLVTSQRTEDAVNQLANTADEEAAPAGTSSDFFEIRCDLCAKEGSR
ncbi:molybdopterin-dependent oxidoreductase [Salisediminibacterium halotolerans]|uniref:molybdopterin-dependent oxidoreductase n=1 Tax=Salisediminibacterium halotolerans TaxID=517425 RepID=UPI000EAED2D8|nr:molybdopterin-dependent oxidoreductase [Salisediminibacterium halotolerans]RLJ75738.1 anaerobic selenocysteine-containing dehydrogenase [Actinophytocola xinjiangensis]RPE89592.1 anaerobic selenocysteine-containing dehydrogenase [Salisediminibacterium halotolerans]TWG36351.1 anaerobic selenocysteine-containing dehydrogenase [Salisediminibacterium halotolerans]GEL09173.1 dehydrogenase [Salisediminibacterium halotolerans]